MLSDIFLPERKDLALLAGDEHVEGTVIEFSDSGLKSRYFAVVDVVRKQSVVVPIDKLEVIAESRD